MTTETMTVHRALAELKTLDKRINKAIDGGFFVTSALGTAQKLNGVSISIASDEMKSTYSSIESLIARRDAMRRAVIMSNATTEITVGGKTYLVAEAIEFKNSSLPLRSNFLDELTLQYNAAVTNVAMHSGEKLEEAAEEFAQRTLANQGINTKDTAKSSEIATQLESIKQVFRNGHEYVMIDPLGIAKKIEEMNSFISDFETELDAALSVSNAITVITFEY